MIGKGVVVVIAMALLAALSLTTPSARAETVDVSGNPSSGGWSLVGNSLSAGVFVGPSDRYNYNLYWTQFTVSSGSELLGGGFQVGDEVIGIGAVSVQTKSTSGAITSGVRVADLSQVNAKYGTLTNADGGVPLYSPAPGANASHSAGNGGAGSILLSVGSQLDTNTLTSVRLDRTSRHDGTTNMVLGLSTDTDYLAKYIASTTGSGSTETLNSFEFFLNNSELVRQGYTPIPLGAGFITTYHHVSNNSLITDAYGQTEAPAPVPLPAAAWGGLALCGMVATKRAARRHWRQ